MCNANPSKTPLPNDHVLYEPRENATAESIESMRNVPFAEVLGALLYLSTRTRPDLSTAVSMLGKYQAAPQQKHWKMMKHVIKYLIGTTSWGISIRKDKGEVLLKAWSDSEWDRDLTSRRSRSGVVITFNSVPIWWSSRLQTTTALSTSEAEFNALFECVRQVVWIRGFLNEIGIVQTTATNVYQDNLGSIAWTKEVQGLRNVKHIGIGYHYVKENVRKKHVQISYVPSASNEAESFTKALVSSCFTEQRDAPLIAPCAP